jgi:FdhD protein
MSTLKDGTVSVNVTESTSGLFVSRNDLLAVEEPLEIRLDYTQEGKRLVKSISITMRTPGDDRELAAGFLFTEGIVQTTGQIEEIRPCGPEVDGRQNTIRVRLSSKAEVNLDRIERHFYTSSSCGVCGKSSIEALNTLTRARLDEGGPVLTAHVLNLLPGRLRSEQRVFGETGGLHAAALFNGSGEILGLREDVGRHNAVDKLIGEQFLKNRVPLSDSIILVSGRASFELVQKALMAGIPFMAAVGAPSSLAVELAGKFNMTLLGFVRDNRFNIYSGQWRVR